MPEFKITRPDGKTFKVTAPEGTSEQDVLARVSAHREYGAPTWEDIKHAGKLMIGKDKPEGWTDYALMAGMTAPMLAAGGLAAGAGAARLGLPALARTVAPAIGEMVTAGGLGATQAAGGGGDAASMGWNALLDATVAGLTRGATGALAGGVKVGPVKLGLKEWGAPVRGFEWATEAPEKAIDLIASRLPKGKAFFNVPQISSKPLTAKEAVEGLRKLTGAEYDMARKELASEISRLDIGSMVNAQGKIVKIPGQSAMRTFLDQTSPEKFPPSGLAQAAEGARKALINPMTRAGLESMMVTPAPGAEGMPAGALVGAATIPGILGSIPGAKHLMEDAGQSGTRKFGGY